MQQEVQILPYEPQFYVDLPHLADVVSAWKGIDRVLYDIVNRFSIPQESALEFGVEHGYSTSALANVFSHVRGVDAFCGDVHAGYHDDDFLTVKERISAWPNVSLIQSRYQDFILFDENHYDLIHVDMEHTYKDTYLAGKWAIKHSDVVIFHDTESFREVKVAVRDLAMDNDRVFYNYQPCHGLGILVRQ